jgi:hypothetical protein
MATAQHAQQVAEGVRLSMVALDQSLRIDAARIEEAFEATNKRLDDLKTERLRESWSDSSANEIRRREYEALSARLHALELREANLRGQIEAEHPTPMPGRKTR